MLWQLFHLWQVFLHKRESFFFNQPSILFFYFYPIGFLATGVTAISGVFALWNKRSRADGTNMFRIMLALLFFLLFFYRFRPAFGHLTIHTEMAYGIEFLFAVFTSFFPYTVTCVCFIASLKFRLMNTFIFFPSHFSFCYR